MTLWAITRDPQWPDQMSFYFLWTLRICSAYKLLIILCSASWTWNATHALINSQQNTKVSPSMFLKLFLFILLSFLELLLCILSSHPNRFLYLQLSKTLPVPMIQKLQSGRKLGWSNSDPVCFLSLKVDFFVLSTVQCLKSISICILFSCLIVYLEKVSLHQVWGTDFAILSFGIKL